MNTASITEFRKRLAEMVDRVTGDHEPLVITRDGGKPSAVLLSLEDFASYQETDYLLRSPANAARLAEAIEALENSKGKVRELAD